MKRQCLSLLINEPDKAEMPEQSKWPNPDGLVPALNPLSLFQGDPFAFMSI
jgi:hypothetical protein